MIILINLQIIVLINHLVYKTLENREKYPSLLPRRRGEGLHHPAPAGRARGLASRLLRHQLEVRAPRQLARPAPSFEGPRSAGRFNGRS